MEEASSSVSSFPKPLEGRLPLVLVPKHYDVHYQSIDFQHFTFTGTVSMTGTAEVTLEETRIVLNSSELQLTKATLTRVAAAAAGPNDAAEEKEQGVETATKPPLTAVEFRYKMHDQVVEIVFDEKNSIEKGQDYVLKADFIGILNDQMRGLYRSTYKGLDGETHVMATTQFESTDARRAFPCMDEPALKATFCVSVVVPLQYQVISNTTVASMHTRMNKTASNTTTTYSREIIFQKTPKMSTYLVALVVGQFDCISQCSKGITTTVYTVPGKADQAQFSLDTAVRCLDVLQELYGIPYPLTKLDTLAIPDFAAGAMENWGCMTYREAKILEKAGMTSESTRRGMARTICHETAHQWFGNLVTMQWWTQLWLKEGVARFMEFVATDKLFPEWDMWTAFVKDVQSLALSLDSMKSSHPVEVEVHHWDEIESIFDSISYAKGASIIRMIACYIGMDKFVQGMRLYLSRNAYGNAVTNDVWGALEEVSGVPVVEFMKPWTLKVGFPILTVQEDGSLHTTRFLAAGREESKSTSSPPQQPSNNDEASATVWPIPVTALVEGCSEEMGPWVISGPKSDETAILSEKIKEWTAAGKWFKLNVGQTGFYRVAYAKQHWIRLSAIMDPNGPLSIADRLGLLSDSFAAGQAGYSSIVDSLVLVADFGTHETADFVIWEELAENLSSLASLFRSEPFYPQLQAYLRRIFSRQMDKLGWETVEGEAALTGALRATTIGILGVAGDEAVTKKAFDVFMAYIQDREANQIHGDLRRTIFRCALRHDEATVFAALKHLLETSSFAEEQRNCLSVMGCVKDADRHAEMLEYVNWSGNVKSQDISFPLATLAGATDAGGLATWNYLKQNYENLYKTMNRSPLWKTYVALSCRGLTTIALADEVEQFFEDPAHPIGSAKARLAQALEVVRTKAGRRNRDRSSVEQYLAAVVP